MGPHGAPWGSNEAPMRPHGWHLQVQHIETTNQHVICLMSLTSALGSSVLSRVYTGLVLLNLVLSCSVRTNLLTTNAIRVLCWGNFIQFGSIWLNLVQF